MKELRFRLFIILAAIAVSVYLLYPTYKDYQNTKKIAQILETKRANILKKNPKIDRDQLDKLLSIAEDSIKSEDPSIREARLKRIKLGLDLQGGMRVVLEVNTSKLLEKIAKNPDDVFKSLLKAAETESNQSDASIVEILGRKLKERGIRLSRYFGTIRDDDDKILSELKKQAEDAVSRGMQIIRNRVDQYGVSEPSIQQEGSRRIVVELPGVAREQEARQLLQGTALLEFRLVKDPEFTFAIMQKIDNILAGKKDIDSTASDSTAAKEDTAKASTASKKDTAKKNKQLTQEEFAKEHPFFAMAMIDPQQRTADAYVRGDIKEKLMRILHREDVQKVIPNNVEFVYSAKPFGAKDGQQIYMLYLVNKNPELTGNVVVDARATIDPNSSAPMVSMEMNSEGATEWARITGANVNKRCAIMLDGSVFTAPNIRQKITGGRSQIEGSKDMNEAKLLEIVLKAGALPAPVDIIEERTVGPSLGQDSIASGFNSAIIGYILVAFFMIVYYQKSGTIAAISLMFTILFVLGVLAGFGATLTLPGIAAIILTIGMAVDANVLIYERIREEQETGKTVRASVDGGFSKAFSAILDSNITTMITGIILYQFGTGPVKGFALNLMIGIAASLFSALVIARVIFDFMLNRNHKISIG
jgi:preprotein translocase subunit SecD